MSPMFRAPVLAAAAASAAVGAARAQQPDTVTLRPLVVTATRLPAPADAVSGSLTVLRGEDLAARGVHSVADALRDVLGVAVARAGSWGAQTSLFLRGGESDYVKVLVDGVPVNEPGGAFDFSHLTTDAVDRIEILRGPASVLYGSDAVTGVVQVFTRRGAGRARGALAVAAGTAGTGRVSATVAAASGWWASVVSASRATTEGIYALNNRYDNRSAAASARVTPDARTDATLVGRWRDAESHFPTDGAGRPVDANQQITERGPTVGLDVRRRFGALEGELQLAWHETERRYRDEPDGPTDTAGVYAYRSRSTARRAGLGARLHWRSGPGRVLTAGLDAERQSLTQASAAESEFGPFTDSVDVARGTRAYYVQALAGLDGPVSLTAGARLEDDARFGTHVTWRGGVSWRVAAATRVRVAVGTAFKEPTFIEQFGGAGTIGNPDLAPERSTAWETGVEQGLAGGRVRIAVTYFGQRFVDMVAYTFTPPPPGTSNYFNIGGARADGAETSIRWAARGISAEVGYTFLATRVTKPGFDPGPGADLAEGERLLRRPTHSGQARLLWVPAGRWRAGLEVRYVGDRDDLDFSTFPFARVRLPGYAAVGLSAAVDLSGPGRPGFALRARVDNVFGSVHQEVYGFRSPGRTIVAGAELRLPS
jgi:vitamin B12 transporter